MSSIINTSNFKVVTQDDFTKDHAINTGIWQERWGYANQFRFTGSNGLLISGSKAQNWNPVGIEELNHSKSGGHGYGLYQFTGNAAYAGQGAGICFLLWPSDNVWLPSSRPSQATEIDMLESWDGSKTGVSTLHFYSAAAPYRNGQISRDLGTSLDITRPHTYSLDWERGSLTYYVDGRERYQDTSHAPKDFADGGVNETMGAEIVGEAGYVKTLSVGLYIRNISYSSPLSPTNTPSPAPSPAPPTFVPAKLVINTVAEDHGTLLIIGSKATGSASTIREFMDGRYLGVLRDNFKDGAFSMHINDVANGAHNLHLEIDRSSASAIFDFTKTASGVVDGHLIMAAPASAGVFATLNEIVSKVPSILPHIG